MNVVLQAAFLTSICPVCHQLSQATGHEFLQVIFFVLFLIIIFNLKKPIGKNVYFDELGY